MPSYLILIPLFGLLAINLPFRACRREAFPFAIAFLLFQIVQVFSCSHGATGFLFPFAIDDLSRVVLLAVAIVALAAAFTGWGTITDETQRFSFFNLLLLAVTGMNGIVMVNDLFSLYVFIELAAVSSFILIALRRDQSGLEGAFKYIVLSALATALMLSAIALLLIVSGGTGFERVALAMRSVDTQFLTLLAVALFVAGLLIKSGVMPFHGWLPDAYTGAPAPVSVLLAGIVTKATGVYTLIRLAPILAAQFESVRSLLMLAGALSIVAGALAALGQDDFKRMLAYSSISQVGYIVLSLGLCTPLGLAGAIFHFFNHSIFKSLLFVNAAAVEQQTGTRNMNDMGGLAARMPVTSFASVVALLSTAGVPPLAGFWSKLVIIVALCQAGRYGYAAVAVLASLLTLAYFLVMQRRVFFGQLRDSFKNLKEVRASLLVPTVGLALITIAVGLLIPWIVGSFLLPIGRFF